MESLSSKIYYSYSWKINIRRLNNSVARNVYFDSIMIKIPFLIDCPQSLVYSFVNFLSLLDVSIILEFFKGLIKFY